MSDSFLAQFGDEEARTVTEYTRSIKRLLEGSFGPEWIRGEVSNFRRQASGHLYFSLKDEGAQLPVVMFRGNASGLSFDLDNGSEVMIYGELSVYEPHGRYQLIARAAIEAGQGRLHREFERLKKALFEEGLFDPDRKKPLPVAPRKIAFITSPSGAAIQDFIRILKRRGWRGQLSVIPAKVQGKDAAASLRSALDRVLTMGGYDVVVLGRGGGSLEDLWCFNDESLARDVAASPIPTISAVGHEIDFSLTDFASDIRAETPSAAAELISSAFLESMDRLDYARGAIDSSAEETLEDLRRVLAERLIRLKAVSPQRRFENAKLRTDELSIRLGAALSAHVSESRNRLSQAYALLGGLRPERFAQERRQRLSDLRMQAVFISESALAEARHSLSEFGSRLRMLHPDSTLKRGYAMLSEEDGALIQSVKQVERSKRIKATLADGETWLEPESKAP